MITQAHLFPPPISPSLPVFLSPPPQLTNILKYHVSANQQRPSRNGRAYDTLVNNEDGTAKVRLSLPPSLTPSPSPSTRKLETSFLSSKPRTSPPPRTPYPPYRPPLTVPTCPSTETQTDPDPLQETCVLVTVDTAESFMLSANTRAKVISTVECTNGYIHVIDGVLLPYEGKQPPFGPGSEAKVRKIVLSAGVSFLACTTLRGGGAPLCGLGKMPPPPPSAFSLSQVSLTVSSVGPFLTLLSRSPPSFFPLPSRTPAWLPSTRTPPPTASKRSRTWTVRGPGEAVFLELKNSVCRC